MSQRTTSKAALPQIKPAAIRRFHAALHAWYETHGRHDLPWRTTQDAYAIWLSEVMLQQTQVSTVLARFYQPFLSTFPTIESLADAPRERVMKAWEGLGYYRRAGNLHEAAKRARHGLPEDFDALLALPGIGKNTAHAVLAFAHHQPVAILEANVKRIIARIFALAAPSNNDLWSGAEQLLNRDEPFHYNQAMMDLGSMVCTPKAPDCPACPANSICLGKVAPERYPTPKIKKQVPTRDVIIHVREDAAKRLFLETRDAALLGGLYGFPQTSHQPSVIRHGTEKKSAGDWRPENGDYLGTVTHVYSHFKLIGHVVRERFDTRMNSKDWHSRGEIAALPLSKLDHKVLSLVENCHSAQKKRAKRR